MEIETNDFSYEDRLDKCITYLCNLILEFYQDNPKVLTFKQPMRIMLKWVLQSDKDNLIKTYMENCTLMHGIVFLDKKNFLKFLYNIVYISPQYQIISDEIRDKLG